MDKINYKRRSILLTIASFANIGICVLLFMGAKFFIEKGNNNFISMKDLAKEKGITIAEELYNNFKKSDDVRKDSPEVLSRQSMFDVKAYDLSLWFDVPAKTIKGELIMKASSLSDTLNIIYMNLYDNMKVSNVGFMLIPESPDSVIDLSNSNNWNNLGFKQENNYLIINATNNILHNLDFLVRINYSGTPKKLGFDSFSFKEIYGNTVIYNLSEPNYGPAWWPSKDLPEDKAFTKMHLNAPPGMTGVSNGTLRDTVTNPDGTKTYSWQSSYPIATYLVSLVVTKFSYWEGTYTSVDSTKQMPLTYYVFPHDSAKSRIDWKVTPAMLGFLSKTFGEYAFINEKYGMAQFGWTNGSMEHQTITSMGYLLMTGDNAYDNVVVHEMAHQWFGDAVTLKDWKNIWLNEGFASYAEALWEESINGKQAYFDYMKNFDYGFFSGTVYAPDGFIDSPPIYATVYQKGAWVLHMLRGVMGDEVFFNVMRTYYEKYKFKNVETSDFVDVAEEISGKKLDWFFDEWVYNGRSRPKYEYSWKFEDFQGTNSGKYTVRLQLKQVQEDYPLYKMPIKIRITTEAGSQEFTVFNDTKEQNFLFAVDSKPKEVFIDPDGWILKKIAKGKY